jgi:DNA-binding HxlR family transcriptional regulator
MTGDTSCPVEFALDVLGGKWRVVILARLKEQPCRYSDLRRLVPRVSQKMLTQRLHELTTAGLVEHDGGLYSLSPRGESARPVLQALFDWGEGFSDVDAGDIARKPRTP